MCDKLAVWNDQISKHLCSLQYTYIQTHGFGNLFTCYKKNPAQIKWLIIELEASAFFKWGQFQNYSFFFYKSKYFWNHMNQAQESLVYTLDWISHLFTESAQMTQPIEPSFIFNFKWAWNCYRLLTIAFELPSL